MRLKNSTKIFGKEPFPQYEILESVPQATMLFMVTSLITQCSFPTSRVWLHFSQNVGEWITGNPSTLNSHSYVNYQKQPCL